MGAVRVLQRLFPEPGRLQFIYADLGDAKAVSFFTTMRTLTPYYSHSSIHLCVGVICFALNQ